MIYTSVILLLSGGAMAENNVSDEQIENFLSLFETPIDGIKSVAEFIKYRSSHRSSTLREPNTPVIISLENITKSYKIGRIKTDILKNVNLRIHQGEIVAITGRSGSGKSTLLQLIGCLDKPNSGIININGNNTAELSDNRLSILRQKTIGFVFQSFYLQPFLKLDQNVSVPAMFAGVKKKIIESKLIDILPQVGMDDYKNHYPKELSGGQIQRAAIARALINSPPIILADEPTGNLDSINSDAIISLFKKIRDAKGTTVIIVTHDLSIARQADRIITVKDGIVS